MSEHNRPEDSVLTPPATDDGATSTPWMRVLHFLRLVVLGPPRDPLSPETRQHITLIAFLAWVGLGADGLSSSCYGPEESFRALLPHTDPAIFLAFATALTVFVISVAYNQVIELFPSGGGGYKVATRLLGRHVGLVSGSALVVDYMLTIAISIAAGVDALFSFLPRAWGVHGLEVKILLLIVLLVMNLRGVKESIRILLPLFLGFVLTHAFLIIYGVGRHAGHLSWVVHASFRQFSSMTHDLGWIGALAIILRAYALGGGTYTGIEAVSNSVNMLKEPRVHTGKWTMFYMALSLSFTAGGIILLYLLWNVRPVAGETLNAVVFSAILSNWHFAGVNAGHAAMVVTMLLEAALLFVAANTGYVGGPAVLANMAVDHWLPHRFSQLSDRLVTKNGIVLMGMAALIVLLATGGSVDLLVVLYSINVFLTFTLTLLGLCVYWWRHRDTEKAWFWRLPLSLLGLAVTGSILIITLMEKFDQGGWVTTLVTGSLIGFCLLVSRHYGMVHQQLESLDDVLTSLPASSNPAAAPQLEEGEPAAVFFVSSYRGIGIHTLLNSQRLFPGRFRNFVFLTVGEVDTAGFREDETIEQLQRNADEQIANYVNFCHAHGMAATGYVGFGTDAVEIALRLADSTLQRFPGSVFFAGTLVFRRENWLTRMLHNYTALAIQRKLHLRGVPLVIMPMLVEARLPASAVASGGAVAVSAAPAPEDGHRKDRRSP
ncbi:MAG: APC family permease [Acidiferrobacterales bacterium]